MRAIVRRVWAQSYGSGGFAVIKEPCFRPLLVGAAFHARRTISSLVFSESVRNALDNGDPVVCLESTIITHGMSYPSNLKMAQAVERTILENGATPATIAILNGKIQIGLEPEDLRLLAKTGQNARKISRRDLASAIADGATGGTTVSGTMILAKMAGIKVFVTGGIGGVHRNAESTMDVSNDLNELSRNDVAVVCAGPKAILDIPRTLEYLETMGVTVTTIGQKNLPAFYSQDSGIRSPQTSLDPAHAAKLIEANHNLELGSSVLVCVPIPAESSIDGKEMADVIDLAIEDAYQSGIMGKDTTPYLLAAVSEATKGRSLAANIALVLNNARVGAQIASHLYQAAESHPHRGILPQDSSRIASSLFDLEEGLSLNVQSESEAEATFQSEGIPSQADVLVVGGVAVDITCSIASVNGSLQSLLKTSNPGKVERTVGGVAGNLARAVSLTNTATLLCSSIGGYQVQSGSIEPDVDGSYILSGLAQASLDLAILPHVGSRSATYTCVQAGGELLVAVADMDIFTETEIQLPITLPRKLRAVIVDANIPGAFRALATADIVADYICFEPTSVAKASTLFTTMLRSQAGEAANPLKLDSWSLVWPDNKLNMTTPNVYELEAMFNAAHAAGYFETEEWWHVINGLDITSTFRMKLGHFLQSQTDLKIDLVESGAVQQAIHLLPYFENIFLTMGSSGVLSFHLRTDADSSAHRKHVLIQQGPRSILQIIYHPPTSRPKAIVSDTGCGDTFTAMLISALIRDRNISQSVAVAQQAAVLTLESSESVAAGIKTLLQEK